jgi:hypothetical protein
VCGYTRLNDEPEEIHTCEEMFRIINSHEWIDNPEQFDTLLINGTITIPFTFICKKCGIGGYTKMSYLTCDECIIKDIIE